MVVTHDWGGGINSFRGVPKVREGGKKKRREPRSRRRPNPQMTISYGQIAAVYHPGASWNPQIQPLPGRWNGCARYASKIM